MLLINDLVETATVQRQNAAFCACPQTVVGVWEIIQKACRKCGVCVCLRRYAPHMVGLASSAGLPPRCARRQFRDSETVPNAALSTWPRTFRNSSEIAAWCVCVCVAARHTWSASQARPACRLAALGGSAETAKQFRMTDHPKGMQIIYATHKWSNCPEFIDSTTVEWQNQALSTWPETFVCVFASLRAAHDWPRTLGWLATSLRSAAVQRQRNSSEWQRDHLKSMQIIYASHKWAEPHMVGLASSAGLPPRCARRQFRDN